LPEEVAAAVNTLADLEEQETPQSHRLRRATTAALAKAQSMAAAAAVRIKLVIQTARGMAETEWLRQLLAPRLLIAAAAAAGRLRRQHY
jgi:hypothetical protein